jgi:hypothetical protein
MNACFAANGPDRDKRCTFAEDGTLAKVAKAAMSDVGQPRRFDLLSGTSDMPSRSDVFGPGRHFAKVPRAELSCLEARQIQSMKNGSGPGTTQPRR